MRALNFAKIKKQEGFTLIELLIVIAILAILATVVFVAIDPLSRFQDTRNSKRSTDVGNILSAIKLKLVDDKGVQMAAFTGKATNTPYMIANASSSCNFSCANPATSTTACIDMSPLVTSGYLPALPVDPGSGYGWAASSTGYYIIINANKTYTVGTCQEELGTNAALPDISVTM